MKLNRDVSNDTRRSFLKGLLGAGAAMALPLGTEGCGGSELQATGWTDALKTEFVRPREWPQPRSARDLVEVVKTARRYGASVRMTGSGHSFSDVALSDDWLLSPKGLTRIFPSLDSARLERGKASPNLVRFQSGVRVRELNKELHRRGLALENMGGWDGQTMVGAVMTGTHGSGLAYGPLASQIASLQLVTEDGDVLQIEPSDGISDAAGFPRALEEDPSITVRLKKDDALFNAAVVSFGCMGVVYAVVLRAVPEYWLREKRTLKRWSELAAPGGVVRRLMDPAWAHQPGEPDHIEIYFTPYAAKGESQLCVLTERTRLYEPPPETVEDEVRGSIWFDLLEVGGLIVDRTGLLPDLVNGNDLDQYRQFHETALRGIADKNYTALSYKVFNLGLPNDLRAYGIEMAFDICQTIDATNYLMNTVAPKLARSGVYHTAPPSLRFVAESPALLAMQHGRRSCMLEMGMLVGARGSEELLRYYEDSFIAEFGARPHWGLDRNALRGTELVERLYARTPPGTCGNSLTTWVSGSSSWPKWLAIYEELNAHGTFDGYVTDRLGISRRGRRGVPTDDAHGV